MWAKIILHSDYPYLLLLPNMIDLQEQFPLFFGHHLTNLSCNFHFLLIPLDLSIFDFYQCVLFVLVLPYFHLCCIKLFSLVFIDHF